MAEPKRRSSYNDAAARITGDVDDTPLRPTYACAAHGCPIVGSITIGGARTCFVHAGVNDRARWDETTARIRNRMLLVEASRDLRVAAADESSQLHQVKRRLPDDLLSLIPTPAWSSRYRALLAIEGALLSACRPTEDRPVSRSSIDSARSLVRSLAMRKTAPVVAREPGGDDE